MSNYDRALLQTMLRNEADMAAQRRVKTVLEYLAIQPGERVLDCGCGLGWFLKIIATLYDRALFGLDNDLARLRSAQREVNGAHLLTGDILHLPYPNNTFDKIVLSEVLEHVPDDLGGLREVVRVLKPGGLVAITVPHHNYPMFWDPINWWRERLGVPPIRSGVFGGLWTNHLRLYRRDDLLSLIRGAHLIVEDVRELVHYCVPFAHNLVYGLGMRLVQRGVLPTADRFRYTENSGSYLSPLNLARGVFNAVDRLNDPVTDAGRPTVILAVKASKPVAGHID